MAILEIMANFIKTDSTYVEVQPKNGKKFSLKELQEYVAGYIELIELPITNEYMIINEEGKIMNLPENRFATAIVNDQKVIMPHDYIAGDALIIKQNEID